MPRRRRRDVEVMKSRLAATLVLIALAGPRPAGSADAFKVIVNSRMTGRTVSRETLSQVYLGKVERWGDGKPIAAVDLSTTSPVRAAFSQSVVGMSVVSVRMHWTRTMVTDHFPPMVRSTDEDVIAFVGTRTGAVGYVSADAVLPDTVQVVAVQ
jgi:ABC-type phosphate transport system substrate-binding protein